GGRRVLEGAHRWSGGLHGPGVPGAPAGVLDLARPGRGPARRPHGGRAGRGVRAALVRRRPLLEGSQPDARRGPGVLGRPVGRSRGGGGAMTATDLKASADAAPADEPPSPPLLGGIDHLEWWVG